MHWFILLTNTFSVMFQQNLCITYQNFWIPYDSCDLVQGWAKKIKIISNYQVQQIHKIYGQLLVLLQIQINPGDGNMTPHSYLFLLPQNEWQIYL